MLGLCAPVVNLPQMMPASGRSPPTKISSPSGKTLTPMPHPERSLGGACEAAMSGNVRGRASGLHV